MPCGTRFLAKPFAPNFRTFLAPNQVFIEKLLYCLDF